MTQQRKIVFFKSSLFITLLVHQVIRAQLNSKLAVD